MPLAAVDLGAVSGWMWVWIGVVTAIGLVWLRRHGELNRAGREPVLSAADAAGPPEALPALTVLVAAKDEEANIRRCVEGLLAQAYPRLEVVAVDDRSGDRTGAILDELAARDPRLRVVHVRELPPGWYGKHHAMHQGLRWAGGELLCFTDADCAYHDPALLAAAVRFAQRTGVEFLSVLPDLEAHTFWERVVQPPAGGLMVFWFPPRRVNDPRSRRAYANGAFMLMSRATHQRLGGHARALTLLNEDIALAEEAKRQGVRLHVMRGGGMYSVRMYAGLRQVWAGWSRNFYGVFRSVRRLLLSILFLSIFSLLPYATLIAAPLAGPAAGPLAAAAAFAILAQQSVLWRFYAFCRTPARWALTYPLGAALCAAMMVNAILRLARRGVWWRGTRYDGVTSAPSAAAPAAAGTSSAGRPTDP